MSNLAEWLLDECYQVAGDLTETIVLVLPDTDCADSISLAE